MEYEIIPRSGTDVAKSSQVKETSAEYVVDSRGS